MFKNFASMSSRFAIPFALAAAGAALAFAFYPTPPTRVDVSLMRLDDAAVQVVGEPKVSPVLYVFASADCPFCRKLHPELSQLAGVRIYTFFLPGHTDESKRGAMMAWCSADRVAAWGDVLEGRREVDVTICDGAGVDRNLVVARAMGLSATPTLVKQTG
jgi:thiol:disulfide interchange protein DsbC